MSTLFISDLHLTIDRPDITRAFLAFMQNKATGADALYVLGDLFDAWIGDDHEDECIAKVKAAFRQLTDQGVPVYFVHGNRDFLIGKRFARETGITLLPEKCIIDLYGQPALIMHGDTLCTLDVDYQAFRKKSRSWWWQGLVKNLPLRYRRYRVKAYKAASKEAKQMKSQEIMDVTPQEVVRELEHFGTQLLIHGHTHRPAVHSLSTSQGEAKRIVLGDWYTQGSMLECTPAEQTLSSLPFAQTQPSGSGVQA